MKNTTLLLAVLAFVAVASRAKADTANPDKHQTVSALVADLQAVFDAEATPSSPAAIEVPGNEALGALDCVSAHEFSCRESLCRVRMVVDSNPLSAEEALGVLGVLCEGEIAVETVESEDGSMVLNGFCAIDESMATILKRR